MPAAGCFLALDKSWKCRAATCFWQCLCTLALLFGLQVLAPAAACPQVFTCGDIGHPASELRKRYPQLDSQLAVLPELWWHCPANKPNCALQKCFGSHETKEQVMVSPGELAGWLGRWPGRCVAGQSVRCLAMGFSSAAFRSRVGIQLSVAAARGAPTEQSLYRLCLPACSRASAPSGAGCRTAPSL